MTYVIELNDGFGDNYKETISIDDPDKLQDSIASYLFLTHNLTPKDVPDWFACLMLGDYTDFTNGYDLYTAHWDINTSTLFVTRDWRWQTMGWPENFF